MSDFKQCPNGHYYLGDKCPYCEDTSNKEKEEHKDLTKVFEADTANQFKQCPNGHYYQGDKCPYCKSTGVTVSTSTEKVVAIGSASDNDCIIDYPEVAPHHCKITKDGSNIYLVVLEGKGNTFVNGKAVDGSCTLKPNDEVMVGIEKVQWGHHFASVIGPFRELREREPFQTFGIILPPTEKILEYNPQKIVGKLVSITDSSGVGFQLYEGRNIIGRDDDCNITVNDDMVSAKHAVLLYRAGKYSIADQQSTWGTFVNDEDIEFEPHYLQAGDIITIGNTKFKFYPSIEEE